MSFSLSTPYMNIKVVHMHVNSNTLTTTRSSTIHNFTTQHSVLYIHKGPWVQQNLGSTWCAQSGLLAIVDRSIIHGSLPFCSCRWHLWIRWIPKFLAPLSLGLWFHSLNLSAYSMMIAYLWTWCAWKILGQIASSFIGHAPIRWQDMWS
jgi:hypothetical protein